MTTTAWAHLPNARHIDAVLADLKARPKAWAKAYFSALKTVTTITASRKAAITLTSSTRNVAAARRWMMRKHLDGAWVPASDAMDALIAWDSSADLLDLSPDALRTLIDVAPAPVCHQAALLLPWAIVREGRP